MTEGRARRVPLPGIRPVILAVIAIVGLGTLVLVLRAQPQPSNGARSQASPGTLPTAAPATSGPTTAAGPIWFLAPTGSDANPGTMDRPWLSLAKAAPRLRPGDTLFVRGGIYPGQSATWPSSGAPGSPITVQAYGDERPVFDGLGRETMFVFFRGTVHDVVLKGLAVTGYAPNDGGIVDVFEGAHDVTLDAITMYGNPGAAATDHLIYIAADQVHDITVVNSRLDDIGGGAIHIFHSPAGKRLRFAGNMITNCHWGVIVTSDADQVRIEHNTFAGNDIAVEVAGASNVTILDNLIERSRAAAKPGVGIWIDDPAVAPGLIEDYNLWDPGEPPAIKTNARSYDLSGWRAASGMSSHSIEADPRLGPDLRPTSDSPAVGAASDGTTIGAG